MSPWVNSSRNSTKPWFQPNWLWTGKEAIALAVWKPAARRRSTRVVCSSGSTAPLQGTPCCQGCRPVKSVACVGWVVEVAE